MLKLYYAKGLPGSGKTTWAKQFQQDNPSVKRVNKDDLRSMVDAGVWSEQNETLIVEFRNKIVGSSLHSGHSIIVDDTGFNKAHEKHLRNIANCYNAEFEIKDFTDVPLETCIERDAGRAKPVGADVIRKMHHQYLGGGLSKTEAKVNQAAGGFYCQNCSRIPCKQQGDTCAACKALPSSQYWATRHSEGTLLPGSGFFLACKNGLVDPEDAAKAVAEVKAARGPEPAPPFDKELKPAIIVDLDGTMCLMGKRRGPFEWHKVGLDLPNEPVVRLVYELSEDFDLVFVSGRDEVCREESLAWLNNQGFCDAPLYMRPAGDMRKDSVVKLELYDKYIRGKFNVLFAIDDRKQVVEGTWRALGLTCLDVAGNTF